MPEVPAIAGVPAAARQAAASIDPEKIRAHVRFLASDLLEGRGPGTRGGQLAAEYIATQFALAGARPAGENGTYFQSVPLMAVHTVVDKTSFTFVPASGAPIHLKYGEDYVTKDQTGAPTVDLDAPIVFVGYGIDAPEYQWNDLRGRRRQRQNPAGHRQPAAIERRSFLQRQSAHLLRPMDLQIRRSSAQGRGWVS